MHPVRQKNQNRATTGLHSHLNGVHAKGALSTPTQVTTSPAPGRPCFYHLRLSSAFD